MSKRLTSEHIGQLAVLLAKLVERNHTLRVFRLDLVQVEQIGEQHGKVRNLRLSDSISKRLQQRVIISNR